LGNWFGSYGLYLLGGLVVLGVGLYFYFRTPSGRYLRDRITLRIPVIGKIALLNELARACRTIALLFQVGIPLPEIMTLAAGGADNRLVTEALTEVHYGLLRGEGLSQPMMQNPLFLPLMVQMAGVGEETGKLDDTLSTAAVSFEFEADERTSNAVGLIQPAMTIIIGLVVGFLAITMFSMLYSLTGSL
jgi:type IV pilus assembly protein PilC